MKISVEHIRYIGPVAIAKDKNEIWLGIEWDTAGRGKHDGSCVDTIGILHRYFHAPMAQDHLLNKVKSR